MFLPAIINFIVFVIDSNSDNPKEITVKNADKAGSVKLPSPDKGGNWKQEIPIFQYPW